MGLTRVLRRRPGPAISGDAAELFVGINVAGDSLARQQRREIAIGAGDAVVIDSGERRGLTPSGAREPTPGRRRHRPVRFS